MKYSVITFGCRVNQADSLGFEEQLRAEGAEAAAPDQADLVLVNTCSVTASADQGGRQTIRRVARDNPRARIVVTGCYATRRPDEVAALPHVVRVIANDDKPRLLPLVFAGGVAAGRDLDRDRPADSRRPALSTAERFAGGEGSCGASIEPGVAGRTAYTLRVQTGCAEPCAYCIIPATRGRPRSVAPGDVLREVERVVAAGFKEIALTGVHLGSYGRDLAPQSSLIDLLGRIDRHDISCARGAPPSSIAAGTPAPPLLLGASALRNGSRPPLADGPQATLNTGSVPLPFGGPQGRQPDLLFRISSLEPMDCGPDVIDLVASSDRFAPHFHLPLQHASNSILARMRRPYTIEYYAQLLERIRARVPSASIGSDVIVGFPGETDEDFERLASYLEGSPLTHIHVFPYSDRPGTAAAAMGSKVKGAVVRERGRRVREIGRRLTARFRESQIGTVHRGLTLEDGSLVVTGNYLKVRIPSGFARNEWVRVRITHAGETVMAGEIDTRYATTRC